MINPDEAQLTRPDATDQQSDSASVPNVNRSRRRLAGATISASVMMTLSSRSALADHCTVSGMLSGNMSRPDASEVCMGTSPGHWQAQPGDWPSSLSPGPCSLLKKGTELDSPPVLASTGGGCNNYIVATEAQLIAAGASAVAIGIYLAELMSNPGTPYSPNLPSGIVKPGATLMQAMRNKDQVSLIDQNLSFQSAAAYINAVYWGPVQFGYTTGQLFTLINNNLGSPVALANTLEDLNHRP